MADAKIKVNLVNRIKAQAGGLIKGDRGEKGEPGVPGINGKDGINGRDGIDGRNGIDGKDGRGIVSISLLKEEGKTKSYVIKYTDGTEFVFYVKDGEDGKDGKDGKAGSDGKGMSGGAILKGAEKTSRKTNEYNTQSTETYPSSKALYDAIHSIKTIKFLVVEELPQVGQSNIVYLVPEEDGESTGNIYSEWVFVYNETTETFSWEKLGTDVDLSGYATQAWVQQQGYLTGSDVLEYTAAEVETLWGSIT